MLTICLQLKLPSSDGKYYNTDCVNTENAFRLVQSIPSKKAEPFKRWLAKVGYERVQEIEDPELAQKRMKDIYINRLTQRLTQNYIGTGRLLKHQKQTSA